MRNKRFFLLLSLAAACLSILSCGLFTFDLPCMVRGRWIAYDDTVANSAIAIAVFDFDDKGNFRRTEPDQSGDYTVTTDGKYEYLYATFNYSKCTGSLTLSQDSDPSFGESYQFEVVMNSENGPVSLKLSNTRIRKIYELEYSGPEEIYIQTPESDNEDE